MARVSFELASRFDDGASDVAADGPSESFRHSPHAFPEEYDAPAPLYYQPPSLPMQPPAMPEWWGLQQQVHAMQMQLMQAMHASQQQVAALQAQVEAQAHEIAKLEAFRARTMSSGARSKDLASS